MLLITASTFPVVEDVAKGYSTTHTHCGQASSFDGRHDLKFSVLEVAK